MRKRVGIWIRVSTASQAKGESPEHHEFRARQYAEVKEWEVIEVYHLEGVSGKEVLQHSEAKRLMSDIKRGHISALIFSKVARLARNNRELLFIADEFKKYNADLVSLEESIDTSSPSGRFFFGLLANMASWEREEIASRVSSSAKVRAQLGKHIGGTAPFGYMYEDKKLVLNEKEAEIRKQMYDLFLIHKRKTTVANLLNEKGYRTRKRKMFGYSTIRRLLEDPIAKGLQRVNYSKSMGQGKKWELKPKEEWIFRDAPQIITEEIFERVQVILRDQMKNNKQPLNKKLQLFTNFVYCSCGGKMLNKPQATPKYVCKDCKSKISAEKLEELFHSQLKEYVTSQSELKNYLSTTTNEIDLTESRLKQFKTELIQIEEKMNHLLDLNMKGELPTDGFKHHYNPIFEQSKQIKNQIAIEEGKKLALKQQEQNSEFIFKEANILYDTWFDLAHEEKRSVIEIITDKIEIGKEDVFIDLNYLIPPNYTSFKNKEDGHRDHRVEVYL